MKEEYGVHKLGFSGLGIQTLRVIKADNSHEDSYDWQSMMTLGKMDYHRLQVIH